MRKSNFFQYLKDGVGAFADGGVLFPLLVLLAFQGGFSSPKLFASAGLAYLVSGWFFKIPMSVQPLKAIAIAAVAIGASGAEIRVSGFLLGLFCLLIAFTRVGRLAERVPSSVIHSIQLGLGVLLFLQGTAAIANASLPKLALVLALLGAVLWFSSYSLLGFFAVGGIVATLIAPQLLPHVKMAGNVNSGSLRILTILSLVLPQVALTATNSVIATADVSRRYYGKHAERVSERALLISIGVGNLISALWGGLPYCHGSGGVTAHYRGGARTEFSNFVIGFFLIAVAFFAWFAGRPVVIGYPDFLLASLLMAVGIFHFSLAAATWKAGSLQKIQLMASGLAALLTHQMLVVLAVAIAGHWLERRRAGEISNSLEALAQ